MRTRGGGRRFCPLADKTSVMCQRLSCPRTNPHRSRSRALARTLAPILHKTLSTSPQNHSSEHEYKSTSSTLNATMSRMADYRSAKYEKMNVRRQYTGTWITEMIHSPCAHPQCCLLAVVWCARWTYACHA